MPESIVSTLISRIRFRPNGAYLYVSPSEDACKDALYRMCSAAVCRSDRTLSSFDSCDCSDCQAVWAGAHPLIFKIVPERFDDSMNIVASYSPYAVSIPLLNYLSVDRQTQLLIWLERITNKHLVLMTATRLSHILPTILSRSFMEREVPKQEFKQANLELANALLLRLFKGDFRNASDADLVVNEEADQILAQSIQYLLVKELENRLRFNRGQYQTSVQEVQTLLKLVARYLETPLHHNFSLLMRSFQALSLLGYR